MFHSFMGSKYLHEMSELARMKIRNHEAPKTA
jgi:hypothetical protein